MNCQIFGRMATAFVICMGVNGVLCAQQDQKHISLDELRQHRVTLAQRQRRIIMNNDGCDVLYFPQDEPASVQNFLAKRTTPLANTAVDAIAFCPTSSGFSYFTYNTKVGTVLTRQGYEFGIQPGTRNIAKELIDQGTDCLESVVDFAHRSDMELFWSMRMNDTHDAAHRPDSPYFLYPPLKESHPTWLVGEPVKRTPYGRWSSVNYEVRAIRDLAFSYIDEVCRNYDVDGIELDFCRHLCYFPTTALGGVASDQQRTEMTEVLQRVRDMTEEVGLERGRPILIAVRVPDSVGYCRDMGLEIERWMREGLIDMLITTCYFRLNPWEYSVELGHKYGLPVYPCLSDSRVRGESRFRRSSAESYRGRAMNAWSAGADGLHLFNFFDPKAPMWHEIGDPAAMQLLDKLYFVTVRDGDPRSFLARGREYQTVPQFGPSHPQVIDLDRPLTLPIVIGEDLAAARLRGGVAKIQLHLELPAIDAVEQLSASINGTKLAGGILADGWVDYRVPQLALKRGRNDVRIAAEPFTRQEDRWNVLYEGSAKPTSAWRRDRGSIRTHDSLVDQALLVADTGNVAGDYLFYRHSWGGDPHGEAVIETLVKVKSGSSYVIFSNGESGERLGLWPDHIDLYHHSHLRFDMNTTDDFHLYRLEIKERDLQVFVDGQLRIDAPRVLQPRSGYSRNEVAFGAANSPSRGEAWWRTFKANASGLVCHDLVVSVAYGTK